MWLWAIELKSLTGSNQADLRVVAKTLEEALKLAYSKTYRTRDYTDPRVYNWNEYHVREVKRLCEIDAIQDTK